jgi:murein DD-endopeptidase MepM/ murein hydrolase activator NlpD
VKSDPRYERPAAAAARPSVATARAVPSRSPIEYLTDLVPLIVAALFFLVLATGAFAESGGGMGYGYGAQPPAPAAKPPVNAASVALRNLGTETRQLFRAEGKVGDSLYQTGLKYGVPEQIMAEVVSMLGYLIDFQRDLKPEHSFVVIYVQYLNADGSRGRVGRLVYAGLELTGRRYGVWRYKLRDGRVDYFDSQGRSIRTALLRTPMDGAKITSGFGMRMHPILGYTRMHRGVDFAAPKGTEVYASGDGVVEEARRSGGLGIHVRIQHDEGYSTVYGHLSRLAEALKKGDKVKQGQVIGQVGSTGLSTGPHLHYEVWLNEEAIDPATVKFETRLALAGDDLAAFRWQAALVMMKPAVRLAPPKQKTARKQ